MDDTGMRENGKADSTEFIREAESRRHPLVIELMAFLGNNKKWWLLPIVVALLIVAGLVILGSTAAAPFIYALF